MCQAAPGSCLPPPAPLCANPPPAVPVRSRPVQLCLSVHPSVRLSVCPPLPGRAAFAPPPSRGTAFSCALPGAVPCPPTSAGGDHTRVGWGHPTSSPHRGAGLAPLMGQPFCPPPPPPGRCWGSLGSLPYPDHQPCQPRSGAPSSAAAKPPLPIVCLSFPFFFGGDTQCHCLPSALRPTCPGAGPHSGRGPGSAPPPPPPRALPWAEGCPVFMLLHKLYLKDPTKCILFIYSRWCVGGLAPLAWFFVINISVRPAPRLCLVGAAWGRGGGGAQTCTGSAAARAETGHNSALQ